jgi:predicted SnoaL-like aldol condensation-catalyzing enzyme
MWQVRCLHSTCSVSKMTRSSSIGAGNKRSPQLVTFPAIPRWDGPTVVEDRDETDANRTLLQTYRDVITVQQHYDRIDEFLADDYAQHAEGFGDGIERVKARYAVDVKPGASRGLTPRFFVADGNFVLSVVENRTDPLTANFDLFRIAKAKIAEHWEVLSPIPPRDQWKNSNGPFSF